jgi:hypothetical protein
MEHIIKDITEKISNDKEPLYKITYILPSYVNFEGDISIDVDQKSVIFNYSTYKENCRESCETHVKAQWDLIINTKMKNLDSELFLHYNDDMSTIYCHKLSVELLN